MLDLTIAAPTSYDEIPYPSYSYSQSHPDRLATLATLFGMSPAPITNCRVLELGCAGGGNLIPMAYGLPESTFVGVDMSARQIEAGRAAIQRLGLRNISLAVADITTLGPEFGKFDYIIAHGLYSWVPDAVKEKVLIICRENLAPAGVCYVSYNTYPGWRMLGILRDMMLYHTRHVSDTSTRLKKARAFLDFVAQAVSETDGLYESFISNYAAFLQGEMATVKAKQDALLFHDDLEAFNDPVYFHQFIERASQNGLQYLAEAEFRGALPDDSQNSLTEMVYRMSDSIIDEEQYYDFLHNRTFRQTLLCHQEVELTRQLRLDQLRAVYLVGRATPQSEAPALRDESLEQFRGTSKKPKDQVIFSTDHPLTKAALVHLNAVWPQALSFEALLVASFDRLGIDIRANPAAVDLDKEATQLGSNLLACYTQGLVEFRVQSPAFVTAVSERPLASPIARLLAEQRGNDITNLRHERVDLNPFARFLIQQLDGSHNRAGLLEAFLQGPIADGALVVQEEDRPVQDTARIKTLLNQELDHHLGWLARTALLIR